MKRKGRNKRIFLVLCMVMAVGIFASGMRTEAASKRKNALAAYAQFLEKKSASDEFALAYINGDKVPELIYGNNAIYTYKNGSVSTMATYTMSYIKGYYKKTGIVDVSYAHGNIYGSSVKWDYYYKVSGKGNTIKLTKCLYEETGKKSTTTYLNSGYSNISKTKFKQQLKKLTKSRKLIKVKYYKNTAANRKKLLKK
jgi:hypothetical protein